MSHYQSKHVSEIIAGPFAFTSAPGPSPYQNLSISSSARSSGSSTSSRGTQIELQLGDDEEQHIERHVGLTLAVKRILSAPGYVERRVFHTIVLAFAFATLLAWQCEIALGSSAPMYPSVCTKTDVLVLNFATAIVWALLLMHMKVELDAQMQKNTRVVARRQNGGARVSMMSVYRRREPEVVRVEAAADLARLTRRIAKEARGLVRSRRYGDGEDEGIARRLLEMIDAASDLIEYDYDVDFGADTGANKPMRAPRQ